MERSFKPLKIVSRRQAAELLNSTEMDFSYGNLFSVERGTYAVIDGIKWWRVENSTSCANSQDNRYDESPSYTPEGVPKRFSIVAIDWNSNYQECAGMLITPYRVG